MSRLFCVEQYYGANVYSCVRRFFHVMHACVSGDDREVLYRIAMSRKRRIPMGVLL